MTLLNTFVLREFGDHAWKSQRPLSSFDSTMNRVPPPPPPLASVRGFPCDLAGKCVVAGDAVGFPGKGQSFLLLPPWQTQDGERGEEDLAEVCRHQVVEDGVDCWADVEEDIGQHVEVVVEVVKETGRTNENTKVWVWRTRSFTQRVRKTFPANLSRLPTWTYQWCLSHHNPSISSTGSGQTWIRCPYEGPTCQQLETYLSPGVSHQMLTSCTHFIFGSSHSGNWETRWKFDSVSCIHISLTFFGCSSDLQRLQKSQTPVTDAALSSLWQWEQHQLIQWVPGLGFVHNVGQHFLLWGQADDSMLLKHILTTTI